METIEFNGWKLAADRKATEAAYGMVETSGAIECGCADCLRFDSVRSSLLPPSVLNLLEKVGVNAGKEVEPINFGPDGNGRDIWNWFYHFVGQVVAVPDSAQFNGRTAFTPLSDDFSIGFTEQTSLVGEAFRNCESVAQIECFYYEGHAASEEESSAPGAL